ncbi:MAG: hypothetical protein ACO3N7_10800 [Kiritimatiellia bacterium]
MKLTHLFLAVAITFSLPAQEAPLDPSIFDGTGKEKESTEAPPPPPAGKEVEEADSPPSPPPVPAAESGEPSAPEEIVLPELEGEETDVDEPPGIPAASGGGRSRATETVESTEKIAPGQAVDFPWDM